MNELDSRTARRIRMIEAAITDEAMSAIDIAEAICIVNQSMLEYIRYLLGDDPKIGWRIHVERWHEIKPGRRVALYRWGGGKNKRKPRALTRVEQNRAYRERAKVRKSPQTPFSALFVGRVASVNAEG